MKTDTPETQLLDRALELAPGKTLTISYRNERERDRARHRLYNTKRAYRRWTYKALGPSDWDRTPWDEVGITRLNSQPFDIVLVKRGEVEPGRIEED